MLENIVKDFENIRKTTLRESLRSHFSDVDFSYLTVVKCLVECLAKQPKNDMNPDKIQEICGSDYQGSNLYVISSKGFYDQYWVTVVSYGSCSHCDTLEGIIDQADRSRKSVTDQQLDDLTTLCLHLVQKMVLF